MFICFKGITSRLSSKNHDNLLRKKESINPFLANVPTLYPLKTPENQRFSRGIKWGHWSEMV